MSSTKLASQTVNGKNHNVSLLDLPESTMDCILMRLSPTDLCRMSEVCSFLRDKCRSDHLWEKHIKHKWGRVFGDVAYKEWEWHTAKANEKNLLNQYIGQKGSLGSFTGVWPNLCLRSYLENFEQLSGWSSNNFMMPLYCSLKSGRFWFPAQLYKGLMVCNALVRYDSKTETFQARQQHGCWRFSGRNIQCDLVRSPPVETPPFVLHVSDCLDSLKPGDRIEIQWRGFREAPYDWWYGVIAHLDSCDENENHCQCHHSEILIVEFKQYSHGSNMRRIALSRKNHGEHGDRRGGFYGGIRKLDSEEEIERWSKLLRTETLVQLDSTLHTQMDHAFLGMPPVAAQVPIL